MTETRYRIETANIPLIIPQGETYYQRWEFGFDNPVAPFPFFDTDNTTLLWKGRCQFRTAANAPTALVSLESISVAYATTGGIEITRSVDGAGAVHTFYALLIASTQTALFPAGKIVYDIEFERLTDGWVIRPQGGKVTISAEVTKS
jgi:hypothetical protein